MGLQFSDLKAADKRYPKTCKSTTIGSVCPCMPHTDAITIYISLCILFHVWNVLLPSILCNRKATHHFVFGMSWRQLFLHWPINFPIVRSDRHGNEKDSPTHLKLLIGAECCLSHVSKHWNSFKRYIRMYDQDGRLSIPSPARLRDLSGCTSQWSRAAELDQIGYPCQQGFLFRQLSSWLGPCPKTM